MNIESWKITDVQPYELNPRVNEAAVDAVAASIREFGFRQPIVVDTDGVIVCGHTRWKAAQNAWFGNIARVLEPGRALYCWGGYANVGNYPPVLKASGLYFSQGLIWDKQHPVLTRKDFMGAYEIWKYATTGGWKARRTASTDPRTCPTSGTSRRSRRSNSST